MELQPTPGKENDIKFNDYKCRYHSTSYYCQPKMERPTKKADKLKKQAEMKAKEIAVVTESGDKQGLIEYQYYFPQNGRMVRNDVRADMVRTVSAVNYAWVESEGTKWSGFSQGKQYAAKWDGILFITEGGKYTFKLGSDDGSKMWIGRRLVVNNDGYHGWQFKSGSKRINPVQHKVSVKYFQADGGHGCTLSYSGPDTGDKEKPVPSEVMRYEKPRGFKEEVFYTGQKNSVAEAIVGEPKQVRVVRQVAMGSTQRTWPGFLEKDGFGCRWTAILSIYRGGRYRFWVKSDDGSVLYVDNDKVVDNDGPHKFRSRYGDKKVGRKTDVNLRLEYFERAGGAGIFLKYMGPDTRNRLRTIRGSKVKAPF
jgi:hypothetical protein